MAPIVAFDSHAHGKSTPWAPQLISNPATTFVAKATLHRPRSLSLGNSPKWIPAVIVAVIITGCCVIALVWKLIRNYYRRACRPMSIEMTRRDENNTSNRHGPGGPSSHPGSGFSPQTIVVTNIDAREKECPSGGGPLPEQPCIARLRRLGDEAEGGDAKTREEEVRSSVVSSDYGNGSVMEISTARPMLLSPVRSTPASRLKVVEISRPAEKATDDDEGEPSAKDGEKTLEGMLEALKK
ncbi:hypothetical protein SLS62_009674 [Diatrype stigma]|uniref:Uncharacterized protein n=1 Tax=Diatrype stigma TaxID=117547 RepID=A0AAN9UDK8_9PEZI